MKKLINFNIVFLIFINFCLGQDKVSGYVLDEDTNLPLNNVAIYDNNSDQIYYSDSDGYFEFIKNKKDPSPVVTLFSCTNRNPLI